MTATSNLTLTGLTLLGGVSMAQVGQLAPAAFAGGGGAVAVVWPWEEPGDNLSAMFQDLHLRNNTVLVNVSSEGGASAAPLTAGGGAVLVTGGGVGVSVTFDNCVAASNSVVVTMNTTSYVCAHSSPPCCAGCWSPTRVWPPYVLPFFCPGTNLTLAATLSFVVRCASPLVTRRPYGHRGLKSSCAMFPRLATRYVPLSCMTSRSARCAFKLCLLDPPPSLA